MLLKLLFFIKLRMHINLLTHCLGVIGEKKYIQADS